MQEPFRNFFLLKRLLTARISKLTPLFVLRRMGKTKRGDYSLTNNDSPSFTHTYNKEALIDFPAEQRYRQLVNHYGQDKSSGRSNTLPSRGRKKQEAAKEKAAAVERRTPPPPPMMKVGRVTISAPTRV